ncbi:MULTISPECIES: hypothetical protein [unclassified Paenibacillus]|uniref:hypothetical protein n=1 Tax=unclassified Paenibacillus TaxID=185978 RepID=UPI0009D27B68|nr:MULTISPECIES: hypothetical protein [unclassified Paenibacillus]SLK18535.1 hypothetical protein SAMN06272722_112176 [Paenibacillus sp. RU5A]SOC75306.1 hypothetical protein SAMN05880581_112176 [Paenibacillus sp. RU26A]SOC77342.1 hypothetical protein SAMN05880586_112176 [Paenibacillus sp. RU5M]
MSLSTWTKRWLKTSLTLLVILIGCSLVFFLNLLIGRHSGETNLAINQVRLRVNPILLQLEQNHERLNEPDLRDQLHFIAEKSGLDFDYVGLDGMVILSSTPSSEGTQINLRSALHYDLNHALVAMDGSQSLNIAFPVMDGPGGGQIGNAIFTIPQSLVIVKSPLHSLFSSWEPWLSSLSS